MSAIWVIPPLDVLEESPLRFLVSAEAVAVEEFAFYCGEETLAHGVVKAVSDGSCGGTDASLFAAQAEGERGILRSLGNSSVTRG